MATGRPRDPCWEHVMEIPDPANPNKRKWRCHHCNIDFKGGASRIKVHLGFKAGQGIRICKKFKKGSAGEVPENGNSSVRPQVADSRNILPSLDPINVPPQMTTNAIHGTRLARQPEPRNPDSISNFPSSFGESDRVLLEVVCSGTEGEGPSNAQAYINDPSSQPCSGSQFGEPNQIRDPQDAIPTCMPTLPESQVSSFIHGYVETGRPEQSRSSRPAVQSFPLPEEGNHDFCDEVDGASTSATRQPAIGSTSRVRVTLSVKELVGQESQRIVDEIWDGLTKDNISPIGVYGMPGVGKTVALKHLHNRACHSEAFCNVFWVTVSKGCTINELQIKIAQVAKAPSDLFMNEDEARRAGLLFNHLREKKSLIILDDVWQQYELEDVGIPEMEDGIQLVLTTRDGRVCERMSCQKEIKVKPLSDQESWTLFEETLRSKLSPRQELIARNIGKECKGLPLAIVVMAGSMRGVNTDHGWEDTLEKLRQQRDQPEDMEKNVFPILLHSYYSLNAKKQECLLLCALHPEDTGIPREELIELCIDEGVICGDSRWKIYNEGHRLLDELEKACLLESVENSNGKLVRMHDVIRDMALYIMNAKSPCMVKSGLHLNHMPDEDEWAHNLQKVSLMKNDISVVPSMSPNCPQLSTLLLSYCHRLHKISECFLERLSGLTVIDLTETCIREVPESITNLEKLKSLMLRGCFQLSLLPCLAKLTSLRKLDLQGCGCITQVPDGLGMLIKLTYLDLLGTRIERIPNGVIGKLLNLQFLHAGLVEVNGEEIAKLKKLESLHCRFENVNEVYIQHTTQMKSYFLVIGDDGHDRNVYEGEINIHGRLLDYSTREDRAILLWGQSCKVLWDYTCRVEDLKELRMVSWPELSSLNGSESPERPEPEGLQQEEAELFPNLKNLSIRGCPKLKHLLVVHGRRRCRSPLGLTNLEAIKIKNCEELESIIGAEAAAEEEKEEEEESMTCTSTLSLPPGAFSQLQSIKSVDCKRMKNVVGTELLPLLRNLQRISIQGAESMEEIIIARPLPPATSICNIPQLPLLREIDVRRCDKLKRLLTLELFMLLPNLQKIRVYECKQMKELIGQEIEHDGPIISSSRSSHTGASTCMPPSPSRTRRPLIIDLYDLPGLESICSCTPSLDFIRVLHIGGCPKLRRIPMLHGFPSRPPPLEKIRIWDSDLEWWEALEWDHPESKLALEPSVFIFGSKHGQSIPIQEWRDHHHG